jgi:hypothetical protein
MKTPLFQKKFSPAVDQATDGPADALPVERAARHVYARSAALCLNWSENRHAERTVTIDAAPALGDGGYAWRDKAQFQLSAGELAELTASLFHPGRSLRFVHQSSALKTLTLTYQAPIVLFSLSIGPRVLRVPVRPVDQFLVRNFLIARLAVTQGLPASLVLRSLDVLAAQLPDAPAISPSQDSYTSREE